VSSGLSDLVTCAATKDELADLVTSREIASTGAEELPAAAFSKAVGRTSRNCTGSGGSSRWW
jgi:hypothetical protein